LAAALFAGPAQADVTVLANITKTKVVVVFETITIRKFVEIFVEADYVLNGVAEADAIKNVTNFDNVVTGQPLVVDDDPANDDYGLYAHARIGFSINGGSGVTGVNQSVGNMYNQGNVVVVAAIADDPFAFVDAQAEADERNFNNTVTDIEALDPVDGGGFAPRKTALILESINTNTGIVDVNQDAGNMNNQNNADAIAVALGGVLALSEAALGQENTGNTVNEVQTVRTGRIAGSINGNAGIVKVNQATGNMNNQANNVAISALTASAAITTPTPF
jgi:hypothetical protein